MKLISITPVEWFFELEEGFIDPDGAVMCPVCHCCSLKQVPKSFPDVFTQAAMIDRGEEWKPAEEDLVWVCSGGCAKQFHHE
jgi:hypothetical protein